MSEKMEEFLAKVDKLCFEYKYQLYPSYNKADDGRAVIVIEGIFDDEAVEVLYIDGDGRGK